MVIQLKYQKNDYKLGYNFNSFIDLTLSYFHDLHEIYEYKTLRACIVVLCVCVCVRVCALHNVQ